MTSRAGPGPRGFLATLSQYMLSSAATFGFFLSIGSVRIPQHTRTIDYSLVTQVIRSDSGLLSPQAEAARMQLLAPMIRSRADGAAIMRARWEAERRSYEKSA